MIEVHPVAILAVRRGRTRDVPDIVPLNRGRDIGLRGWVVGCDYDTVSPIRVVIVQPVSDNLDTRLFPRSGRDVNLCPEIGHVVILNIHVRIPGPNRYSGASPRSRRRDFIVNKPDALCVYPNEDTVVFSYGGERAIERQSFDRDIRLGDRQKIVGRSEQPEHRAPGRADKMRSRGQFVRAGEMHIARLERRNKERVHRGIVDDVRESRSIVESGRPAAYRQINCARARVHVLRSQAESQGEE